MYWSSVLALVVMSQAYIKISSSITPRFQLSPSIRFPFKILVISQSIFTPNTSITASHVFGVKRYCFVYCVLICCAIHHAMSSGLPPSQRAAKICPWHLSLPLKPFAGLHQQPNTLFFNLVLLQRFLRRCHFEFRLRPTLVVGVAPFRRSATYTSYGSFLK
jgi:hypothetical protein